MPNNDDDDWASGLGWTDFQESMFADIGAANSALLDDDLLKQAFDIGFFDLDVDSAYREAAREFVHDWLATEYGVEFDTVFDWDLWRENYE